MVGIQERNVPGSKIMKRKTIHLKVKPESAPWLNRAAKNVKELKAGAS